MKKPPSHQEKFIAYSRDVLGLQGDLAAAYDRVYAPLVERLRVRREEQGGMLVAGLCGGQGTGKTTMALLLRFILEDRGVSAVHFSLDDLYLPWEVRRQRQAEQPDNPYYRISRGNPGTHDPALGIQILRALRRAGPHHRTALPAFDKSLHDGKGDRLPEEQWPRVAGSPAVVLFEGWFVGAPVLDEKTLAALAAKVPEVAAFLAHHDPDGCHSRQLNATLGEYRDLFALIDYLIYLRAPSLAKVTTWRKLQETRLRLARGAGMSDEEVERFVRPYLLLTAVHGLQILGDPRRGISDCIIPIGADQLPERLIDGVPPRE